FFTFLVCYPLPLLRLSSPFRLSSFAYSSPSHRCSSTVIVIEMRGSTSKFAAFVELLQWCAIGALGGYSYVMYKTFNELHEMYVEGTKKLEENRKSLVRPATNPEG
ncbi:hypothetical protein Tsubulata_011853, partial [Turnera subulata]